MRVSLALCFVAVVAVSLTAADPAHAQKIRTYGDSESSGQESGGQSGGGQAGSRGGAAWYPGMPAPDQSSQQGSQQGQQTKGQQKGKQGEGGEGEDAVSPSYRVNVYGGSKGSPGQATGPRTTLDMAIDKMYRGVIPGKRDEVEHLRAKDEDSSTTLGPNRLTWIGFQPEDDKTRIFIQTSREADYNMERKSSESTVLLRIQNTKITARNFSRFIDTSYFDRNVQKITTKKTEGGTVEIHIKLAEMTSPVVQQDGGYLYLDFSYESEKNKKDSKSSDENQE